MKKTLFSTTNEKGFILLHVLFVISLLFIIVSYAISSYQSELHITQRQVEQIQVEAIFQMAQYNYKKDLAAAEDIIEYINYEFPDAKAIVKVISRGSKYIEIGIQINLDEDPQNFYLLRHLLVYD